MKVIFCGPSLAGETGVELGGLVIRNPARQGDLAIATMDGATAIGLIDGVFETVAAVWHKEILYAVSQGVRVSGAASMGALRAAECARYGMVGIGRVFELYRSGKLCDDAAVAQLHAPPELGCTPITEALVNVEATLDHIALMGLVTGDELHSLRESARHLFFKQRTYDRIVEGLRTVVPARRAELAHLMRTHHQDIKRADARLLVEHVNALAASRVDPPSDWQFIESPTWRTLFGRINAQARQTRQRL